MPAAPPALPGAPPGVDPALWKNYMGGQMDSPFAKKLAQLGASPTRGISPIEMGGFKTNPANPLMASMALPNFPVGLPPLTPPVPGTFQMPTTPGSTGQPPNASLLSLAWRGRPPQTNPQATTAPGIGPGGQQQLLGYGSEFFQPGRFWGMGGY